MGLSLRFDVQDFGWDDERIEEEGVDREEEGNGEEKGGGRGEEREEREEEEREAIMVWETSRSIVFRRSNKNFASLLPKYPR